MADWTEFAHTQEFRYDLTRLKRHRSKLHAADALPLPTNPQVLAAWALFHSGRFKEAVVTGMDAGPEGFNVVCKASCVYAGFLEPSEKNRQVLFLDVAKRAVEHCNANPSDASAFYWHGYALGRYSQGISVAKALAQGLGGKIKESLEKAIALAPKHADARIALGAFHAEVIDKVGALIGGMTYGAKKDVGLKLFQEALKLNPGSAIAMIEYANALVMLEGDKKMQEATKLYEQAAATKPQDAMERLDVEMAQAELEE